jgi:hypothetical protein
MSDDGDQTEHNPKRLKTAAPSLFDACQIDRPAARGLKQIAAAAGLPKITPVKKRLINASLVILEGNPGELTYQHTVLCQTGLPYRNQKGARVWELEQGASSLRIEAGAARSPETRKFVELPLPFGPKARLALMHLNAEAIRAQSPVIEVESSMTAFVKRLMNGRQPAGPDINAFKKQLSALSAATIRLAVDYADRSEQVNTQIVGAFDLWFPKDERQRVLWPSTVRLSTDYYNSLALHAVPLDERAIAALAHNAMALDAYCWLAQRLHRVPERKHQFIPWPALQAQFGQGYSQIRDFRRVFLNTLRLVKRAYPASKFDAGPKGMTLWNSPPPVKKRLVALPCPGVIGHQP